MFIHMKTYTSFANGNNVRNETCESCGQAFRYTLTRSASGKASSLYGLFEGRAKARAKKLAEKKLAKALERDADLVPCPKCRFVNRSAIAAYRANRYGRLAANGIFLFIAGVAAEALLYFTTDAIGFHRRLHANTLAVAIAIFAIGAGLGMPILASLLRQRIDPNRVSGHPDVPIGTPPAEMEVQTANGEPPTWVKVPSVDPAKAASGEWAFFRAGQLVFPPLCCQCLAPPDGVIKSGLDGRRHIAAPICRGCQKKLTKAAARETFIILLLATGIGVLVGWRISLRQGISGVTPGLVVGIVALIAGFAIRRRLPTRAYRLKFTDRSRGVLKIRFANPAYTALIIRDQGEKDALFSKSNNS